MPSAKEAKVSKIYEPPCLKKLNAEEAKQFLIHHATLGDPGAKELLALFCHSDENSKH
ncbi:MAG TPA: hypothetical protein VF133_15905 [Terriglobales bacterium]